MGDTLRVSDAQVAREIAMEAAKSMWRITIPSSFYEVQYDEKDKSRKAETSYFEEKLTFRIDAKTGYVSGFKVGRVAQKK